MPSVGSVWQDNRAGHNGRLVIVTSVDKVNPKHNKLGSGTDIRIERVKGSTWYNGENKSVNTFLLDFTPHQLTMR